MKCSICGADGLVRAARPLNYEYKGQSTVIDNVHGDWCDACGEVTTEGTETDRVMAAMLTFNVEVNQRNAAPHFVERIRRGLGLTQAEAGRLFGGGPNAFSRYETSKTKPPKSLVLLLRVLAEHPALLSRISQEVDLNAVKFAPSKDASEEQVSTPGQSTDPLRSRDLDVFTPIAHDDALSGMSYVNSLIANDPYCGPRHALMLPSITGLYGSPVDRLMGVHAVVCRAEDTLYKWVVGHLSSEKALSEKERRGEKQVRSKWVMPPVESLAVTGIRAVKDDEDSDHLPHLRPHRGSTSGESLTLLGNPSVPSYSSSGRWIMGEGIPVAKKSSGRRG